MMFFRFLLPYLQLHSFQIYLLSVFLIFLFYFKAKFHLQYFGRQLNLSQEILMVSICSPFQSTDPWWNLIIRLLGIHACNYNKITCRVVHFTITLPSFTLTIIVLQWSLTILTAWYCIDHILIIRVYWIQLFNRCVMVTVQQCTW